jgi:hypothetical protein
MNDLLKAFEKSLPPPDNIHYDEGAEQYEPYVNNTESLENASMWEYMLTGYQQATKESEAEIERLREALEFCKSVSGARSDDIDGMDTQLCEIWISTDEALKEADNG